MPYAPTVNAERAALFLHRANTMNKVPPIVPVPEKATPLMTRKVAERDFERWAEAWDIDTEKEHMDAEDRTSFDNARNRIIRAITKGRIIVSETGDTLDQKFWGGDQNTLTYSIPKGSAWLTMDNHKEKHGMHKIFSYLAEMSKQPSKYFANMDGRDIKVAQDIAMLFLG